MNFLRLLLIAFTLSWILACQSKHTLFEKISTSHSGISFKNEIIENDTINPLDVVNIYNGGGVGIGDFNNDGKQDIFFTGNMVSSKLYLNQGDFEFKDVTDEAKVNGDGRWARGVAVVDINNDGLMDIYICNTIYKDSLRRRNILYINEGVDKNGIPHFTDMASAYGLDVHAQSTMASFFDYDNDGDLDMYLAVNEANNGYSTSVFSQSQPGKLDPNKGKLFRNDFDSTLRHPVFHDVSEAAGIKYSGYGHSATICDLNNDGWKDIYVTNDFLSSNILYINNHDGTFTNRVKEYFKHTSFNSMGQDVVDVNNDGLPDVIELDMNPPDNYRKKMMIATNNYVTYQNFDTYGYQYQYVRNTLSINQGKRPAGSDTSNAPVFSDISFMSGISQTDWSWTPLVMDFDNDSYRDLIVTNGFPKDVSDHDFTTYRTGATGLTPKMEILKQIPEVKISNYAFQNRGDLTFNDVTTHWGLNLASFSNGAAYADLDNDGDMDVVINNINDEPFLYRNTSRNIDSSQNHFLQVNLNGSAQNIHGLGAIVTIHYDHGKLQSFENNPYRGYLSTMQLGAHFGLGKNTVVDSVVITWNADKKQTIQNVKADQSIIADIKNAETVVNAITSSAESNSVFQDVTKALGISYRHKEMDLIDFNLQSVLPHKLSEYCPALATADVDGNGLDDIVIGGNYFNPAQLLLQQKNGSFIQKDIYSRQFADAGYKDEGILLFDANADGKPDLYLSSGGFQYQAGSKYYQDRLFINDGNGNFKVDTLALPQNFISKLCVRAFDFNKDGKMDLFVSGRVDPWHYPRPVGSFIFENESENGKAKFTDVTDQVAPALKNIGLICDALFSDFDDDGEEDLILTGEWMPITFLKNKNGRFENVTSASGISNQIGLWNSIVAGDFRHTGRTDYIVGNVGLNTFYKASDEHPLCITAGDFTNNGGYVAIPSVFLTDRDGQWKEFPANGRDEVIERLPSFKKQFPDFKSFAVSTMDEIIPQDKRKNSIRLKANMLQSCFLRNEGGGKFTMIPLPKAAQVSVLNAMVTDDFDGDGNLDVLISGNDFGTDIAIGRYDALNGLLLKGDGAGGFTPVSLQQSGIYIPGDGKGLIKLRGQMGNYLVAASQNRDLLKVFELNRKPKMIPVNPNDRMALILYKNGKQRKEEFYWGSSFLSQSARFIVIDENVANVEVIDLNGKRRTLNPR